MPRYIVMHKLISLPTSKVVKSLIFGFLAFFIFFPSTLDGLISLLKWDYSGISNIPAMALAIFLAICAWDASITG